MRRSDDDGSDAVVIAIDGHVKHGMQGFRDIPARVAYHADYLRDAAVAVVMEVLADGVLAGEHRLRGAAAEDDNMGALQTLVAGKAAPAQQRNLDGSKIAWIRAARQNVEPLTLGQRWMLDHRHHAIAAPTFARRSADQTGSLDSWHSAHPRNQLLKECDPLFRLFVTRFRQADVHGEYVVYGHAHISRAQALIAPDQQPRADQQHHGEANLEHQESFAEASSRTAAAVRARGFIERRENLFAI